MEPIRLKPEEGRVIREVAFRHFGEGSAVHLHGSRARDEARGGDIDLHIIAADPEKANLMEEVRFLAELETRQEARRVDVLVRPPGHEPEPINRISRLTGVML